MTNLIWLIPMSIILGAISRRWAGGLLSKWIGIDITTQPVRLLWGAVIALIAYTSGAVWWHALCLIPAIWFGSVVFGFWGSLNIWRDKARSFPLDFLLITLHGVGGMALATLGAWYFDYSWYWFLGAGLMCAPVYTLFAMYPLQIPILGCYNNDPVYQTDSPPSSELLWGALVGLATMLTVIA